MKIQLKAIVIVSVVLVALGLSGVFYTLEEGQQAIVVQFGRPVGEPITEAGLHMKFPL